MKKARVLVVFPTAWDERQLAALPAAVRERYELHLDEPRDEDVRWDFDVLGHVEARARAWRGRLDGVTSTSDYPGAVVAAELAGALGLPGAGARSVLCAAHKHRSRQIQRAVAPEAVPDFALFDPSDERSWPVRFPCFVKPVKGSFSLFARRMQDREALRALARSGPVAEFRTHYLRLFELLCARHGLEEGARAFLAEELLDGAQATVEGWIDAHGAHVLGVVDTLFHPGSTSFAGFHYPSHLPGVVQERMGRIACDVARALKLGPTLFNVELFHDAAHERVSVIEVNPRPCGQFADLYEKVDGTNGYELALALATGAEPRVRRGAGCFRAAASIPLRVFRSARLVRAPDDARRAAVEHAFPGTLVWSDCGAGELLRVGNDVEDGQSARYGVVNLGGASRSDIQEKLAAIERELGFELAPAGTPEAGRVT